MRKLIFAILIMLSAICQAEVDIYGDEEPLVWYNDSNTWSLQASSSLTSDIGWIWPANAGTAGQALLTNGTNQLNWGDPCVGSATTVHNLLSATHGDIVANTAARGSMIVGNSTPNWSRRILGASGTIWRSDGTDAAWSVTTNITTLGTISTGTWEATDVGLDYGGTGASLTDPGVDRIFFWDDGAGSTAFLTANTNLSISGTNLNLNNPVVANLTGDVTGDLTGDVTGDLIGDVTGDLIGDVTGDLTGNVTGNITGNLTGNITGDVTGNADTTTVLATGRTIAITGDIVWTSPSFDGSANVTAVGTIQANAVALATDTTGDYIASVVDAGNSTITVTGDGIENATITLDVADNGLTNAHFTHSTDWGDVSTDGSGNVLVDADSITLATDTTGNYVATIADAGNSTVTVANSGTENAAVTLNIINVADSNYGDVTVSGGTWTVTSFENVVTELVKDTSPELGADLDVNGFDIINTGGEVHIKPDNEGEHLEIGWVSPNKVWLKPTGDAPAVLCLGADGIGSTEIVAGTGGLSLMSDDGEVNIKTNLKLEGAAEIRFYDVGNSNYVGFEAPALTANQMWVLPNADGAEGTVMETLGDGTLVWTEDTTANWGAAYLHISNDGTDHSLLGATPGTATANLALIVDGSKNIDLGTGSIYSKAFISSGDEDTQIVFSQPGVDQFYFQAGGVEMMRFVEASKNDFIGINSDGQDIDIRMLSVNNALLFKLDAALDIIRIGSATTNYTEFSTTGDITLAGSARLTTNATGGLIIPTGNTPAPDVQGATFVDEDESANGSLMIYSNSAWRKVADLP